MTRIASRVAVSRLVTTTALVAAAALTLAGCAGQKERSAEEWLADQPFVLGVEIIDRDGAVLGSHPGALAFTVGQRKGLDLRVPSPDGRPRFVLEVRPASNEVVVGPREALEIAELAGARYSWIGVLPLDPTDAFECEVQVRAHSDPVPATAVVSTNADGVSELVVTPHEPLGGVAPGQTAVLYLGTRVLGQCTIDRTVSAVPASAQVGA